MPKTLKFTDNQSDEPIHVVVDKIQTIEYDHLSECTSIGLVGGETVGVSESLDDVREAVNNA